VNRDSDLVAGARTATIDDDRVTVDRMAQGDSSALATLYDRHARAIYSLAIRILSDTAEAEDVVQEVFTQAWRQASRYDATRAPVIGWLMIITRARALDRLRRRRSRITATELDASTPHPRDPDPSQELQAISAEQAERLRGALGSLPDAQRAAIELAYYQGLTQTDIAERLQQPLGTIKTRIRSGLLKLREVLTGGDASPLNRGSEERSWQA
jgi:RNA polymerase sigma-70 factor (ECF subfamily)